MSSVDVYDIKKRIAIMTPFIMMHLNYERFDYPLYDAKNDKYMLQYCNKLCSVDYLTSFI